MLDDLARPSFLGRVEYPLPMGLHNFPDRSDVFSDDLAVAQQEIARLEVLSAEQSEAADTEELVDREVSGSPYSVGP